MAEALRVVCEQQTLTPGGAAPAIHPLGRRPREYVCDGAGSPHGVSKASATSPRPTSSLGFLSSFTDGA